MVEAVKKEKVAEIIYLSLGFTSEDDGGIEFLAPYIKAIKKHFRILVAVEAASAEEKQLDRRHIRYGRGLGPL